MQRTYTATGSSVTSVTTYVNQFVYTETVASNNGSTIPLGGWGAGTDTLRYINFEEGRIRLMQPVSQGNGFDALVENGNLVMPNSMMGVYDYFIMDYQKNVRMILTEETHQSSGMATMETVRAPIEDGVFGQQGTANEVEATRYNKPAGWTANTTASVSRLGNIAGHNLGPNTLQKVMAGDQVSAVVQYYHQAAPASTSNNLVTNIIGNLVSLLNMGGANLSNLVKSNAATIAPQINSTAPPYIGGLSPQNPLATAPKAYLTVLFFDERFNFIAAADGGAVQLQVAATVDGNGAQLVIPNVKAPKNGYTYVYVSNQSDQDVYFDNLQVGITAGNIIEENHYYAYGLKIAGISSKKLGDSFEGMLKNNYQYQGAFSEMDDDIGWNDFELRNYDAQIGRWVQQDPYSQYESPYVGMGNDPMNGVDENGGLFGIVTSMLCPGSSILGATLNAAMGSIGPILGLVINGVNITNNSMSIALNFRSREQINGQVSTEGVGDPGGQQKRRGLDGVNGGMPTQQDVDTRLRLATEKKFLELRKKSWRHTYANHWVNTLTGEENFKSEALGDELVGQVAMAYVLGRMPLPKFGGLSGLFGMSIKSVEKGVSVIGPRATYRQFAEELGANYLKVSDDAWTWSKNEKFLEGVVKRGDDVIFAGKFDPDFLDKTSVLAKEINYLERKGYQWTSNFSKMVLKK